MSYVYLTGFKIRKPKILKDKEEFPIHLFPNHAKGIQALDRQAKEKQYKGEKIENGTTWSTHVPVPGPVTRIFYTQSSSFSRKKGPFCIRFPPIFMLKACIRFPFVFLYFTCILYYISSVPARCMHTMPFGRIVCSDLWAVCYFNSTYVCTLAYVNANT